MSRRAARRRIARPASAASDLAGVLDTLPAAVAICEADGRLAMANAAWRASMEDAGSPPASAPGRAPSGPAMFAAFRRARDGGTGEARLRLAGGEILVRVALAGAGRFWLLAAPVVAPPAAPPPLDPRLAQRNRLEAIGQLAGGVAHDFNNLLTGIGLRADELLQRHPLGDPAYDNLAQIRATVARAAALAAQLLAFASKAPRRREDLDLGELIAGAEVLLRRLLREDMRLEVDLGADLPRVLADPSQLETVLVNLVINARDAIAGAGALDGPGRVRIAARRLEAADARMLGHASAAGDMALIEVADNGPGIPAQTIGAIFEPFFTTKPKGAGTGLGLATVYGIVQQSEGWIDVRSPPGGGAVFRILLPEHHPPLALRPTRPASAAPRRPRDLSGVGRILLVEDEDLVRGVAARLLRGRGYEVIEAQDGEEALAIAREHAGAIAMMISDVVMPGLDGPALLRAVRPHLGDIPVLFVSGYAEAEFSGLLEDEPNVAFLAKPLDFKTLAERVKQALAGG